MAEKIICNPEVFSSRAYPAKDKAKRVCFVIMPFSSEGDENKRIQDAYNHHIVGVAEKCGLECMRADNRRYFRSGRPIIEQIWQAICTADIIIGDFTTANPNVTYEAGLAHSIGKPLIGIVQQGEKIPFDYQHLRHITYTTTHEGYAKLDNDLEIEIMGYMRELEQQEQYPQKHVEATDTASVEELRIALQKLDALQNEKDAFGEQLGTLKREHSTLQRKHSTLAAENDGHLEQITSLSAQIAELEKKLAASQLQTKEPLKKGVGLKPGEPYRFGSYDWRVLDVQDDKVLLLAEDILEKRKYNEKNTNVTWDKCTLRDYLNGVFYESFGDDKKRIAPTLNENPTNPWYGTDGGKPTTDKIFLLSIAEVIKYFGDSGDLAARKGWYWKDGKYELRDGKGYSINDQYNSNRVAKFNNEWSWWWLRSPGGSQSSAAGVDFGGYVSLGGNDVLHEGGVRPALWLNL